MEKGIKTKTKKIGKSKDKTLFGYPPVPTVYDVASRLFSGVRADRKQAELSLYGSGSKLMG